MAEYHLCAHVVESERWTVGRDAARHPSQGYCITAHYRYHHTRLERQLRACPRHHPEADAVYASEQGRAHSGSMRTHPGGHAWMGGLLLKPSAVRRVGHWWGVVAWATPGVMLGRSGSWVTHEKPALMMNVAVRPWQQALVGHLCIGLQNL
jgi:hypothetical protein